MAALNTAPLDQVFEYKSPTHVTQISWTSFGPDTAPPLIFVHGTPWSSRVWVPFAKALASRFKVYLFDNPGYGQTRASIPINLNERKGPEPSVSLATQAEAFAALYHQCWQFDSKTKKPHVVTHDYGGIITLRAHLLHGCEYSSLCLIDVLAVRPFGSGFFRLVAEHSSVFLRLPESIFETMVRAYIKEGAHKPLPPGVEDMLVEPWRKGSTQGHEGFVRQIVQTDARHVEEVEGKYWKVGENMPVKIIWGNEDHWIPIDRADTLFKLLRAKEVVKVPEAGHLIMYDQSERLAIEVTQWLSQCDT